MKKSFDAKAKTRIIKAESVQHGKIRKDSFAAKVQRKVDKPSKKVN